LFWSRGAFLDRDFVLLLQGLQGESFATLASDGEQVAMLASFCPDLQAVTTQRLALKVLVDCSGSMAGDSMDATRRALHEILKELTPKDLISYSRFGSKVQHDLAGLRTCDDATIRELAGLIYRTDADMGGTEMNAALISTFKHGGGGDWKRLFTAAKPIEGETDVLLITDGDIWNVEDVIRTAQSSGHRIFAIGVGSAPAESLLREVAERTGGACELLSPAQDTAECIVRMFRRLRAERSTELQVDWGQEPIWQSKLPATLFGGDTVHVCARFAAAPESAPVLSWRDGSQVEAPARKQTSTGEIDAGAGEFMVRMVASMQMEQMTRSHAESDASSSSNKDALLDLALRYQLVSEQTNLILVHARSDGEKATGLPDLKKIEHMPAAGWGGAGSVAAMRSNGLSHHTFVNDQLFQKGCRCQYGIHRSACNIQSPESQDTCLCTPRLLDRGL
jgi:Ca-activated chloride channel family protein